MKIIHVGLGDFGRWWYSTLCEREKTRGDIQIIAVVDRNPDARQHVQPSHFFATDLTEAIRAQRPDFVLNATPPASHRVVCEAAFAFNLPVLVEKPISENYDDVQALLRHAQVGHKLVVSENYRYFAANRFVREQIHARLQNITGVSLLFRRRHIECFGELATQNIRHTDLLANNYHTTLAQPMAIDIGTHHIDLLRFFTGREVLNVHARLFTPAWSWYSAPSRILMTAEMENGLHFNYEGSMDAL
ncbi:MAG: Gfo/Idh/MocA family oxidoreductase, partial [Defluviitaleaceae bacterium]|nr:Gfo/Idh/MocA family oxidoreductase [Defluviitaleaceae bacterium]